MTVAGGTVIGVSSKYCDRQTDRQTDRHTATAYTALAWRRAVKIITERDCRKWNFNSPAALTVAGGTVINVEGIEIMSLPVASEERTAGIKSLVRFASVGIGGQLLTVACFDAGGI